MSVIYEVNLKVSRSIAVEYRAWLKDHIEEILALPGFVKAEVYEVESAGQDEFLELVVQYFLSSRKSLEDYFNNHASTFRNKALQKFGNRFSATRRILQNILNN